MTDDYWKKFDLLCSELELEGNQKLFSELQGARLYVNGLTDGGYDFLNSFEKAVSTEQLEGQTQQLAKALIENLKTQLKNR